MEFSVGDGVSVAYVSDHYPYTVVEASPKRIVIREDRAIKRSGTWPHFNYYYQRNPHGREMVFTLRKNGVWRERGTDMRHTGARLYKGRRFYQDPSY